MSQTGLFSSIVEKRKQQTKLMEKIKTEGTSFTMSVIRETIKKHLPELRKVLSEYTDYEVFFRCLISGEETVFRIMNKNVKNAGDYHYSITFTPQIGDNEYLIKINNQVTSITTLQHFIPTGATEVYITEVMEKVLVNLVERILLKDL